MQHKIKSNCQAFLSVCVVLLSWCFNIWFAYFSSPTGSAACREVLCLPLGHWRHAQGYGGFRLRAWQEAQGDHGFRQTGNTYSNCVFSHFYLNSKCIDVLEWNKVPDAITDITTSELLTHSSHMRPHFAPEDPTSTAPAYGLISSH